MVATRSALSLFSGCGGFCEGIELAGFFVRCAVEFDRFAAETYRRNFREVPLFEDDVANFLRPSPAAHISQYGLLNTDLVFGGPPCQGFSQIGTRNPLDERNSLYKEFARVVATLRPRLFVMENVPNLLLLRKGFYRNQVLQEFVGSGYSNATVLRVTASDFGVPQQRNRVLFVGTRDEDRFPYDLFAFCEGILNELKVDDVVTVWDAIGDLPAGVVESGKTMEYPPPQRCSEFQKIMRLDFDQEPYLRSVKRHRGIGDGPSALHNHHTKEMQERRRHLISFLKPGQKADSLPKEIWNGTRPEKWRRLAEDAPAYTILAQMHRDLSEWVHPRLDRWITVREAARLQSFHDGFVFVGSEWQQLKQIGNAVPPLLAYAVGRMAQNVLTAMQSGKTDPLPARSRQGILPLRRDIRSA